jgi:hypothetical protein
LQLEIAAELFPADAESQKEGNEINEGIGKKKGAFIHKTRLSPVTGLHVAQQT